MFSSICNLLLQVSSITTSTYILLFRSGIGTETKYMTNWSQENKYRKLLFLCVHSFDFMIMIKFIMIQFIMLQFFYSMIYYGTIFDVFKRIRVISNIQNTCMKSGSHGTD